MTNRKDLAGESGYSKPFALIVTGIAIYSLVVGAAVLAPAGAASDISAPAEYVDPAKDFPDQFVNQPEQTMIMMYYLDE